MNERTSRILTILEELTGSPEVRTNLDIALLDDGLLDSLGFVELLVALSKDESLQLNIAPAEIERNEWSTPRKICESVEIRMAKKV